MYIVQLIFREIKNLAFPCVPLIPLTSLLSIVINNHYHFSTDKTYFKVTNENFFRKLELAKD